MKLNIKGLAFVGFAAAIFAASAHADDKQIVTSKSYTEATYQKLANKLAQGDETDPVVMGTENVDDTHYPTAKAVKAAIAASTTATTYTEGEGIDITNNVVTNTGVRSIATGGTNDANGTISVNTNGTPAAVAVKGLDTAAYKAYTTDDTLAVSTETGKLPTAATVKSYVDTKVKDGTFSITVGNGQAQTFTANSADNTTVTVPMMSAESAASAGDGVNGLVTAATFANRGKFLKGDGTWDTPANTEYETLNSTDVSTGTGTTGKLITAAQHFAKQDKSDRLTDANGDQITDFPTSTEKYPSAKAVVSYVSGVLGNLPMPASIPSGCQDANAHCALVTSYNATTSTLSTDWVPMAQ